MIAAERVKCCKYFSSLPSFCLPASPPSCVSHSGPGSIHPDGGFIFVFVCLLIHASSYSGHRRGFCSTTECKSPRRLIHFHLSLVDIQLLCTFFPVSCSQDVSLFVCTRWRPQWPGRPSLLHSHLLHAWEMRHTFHLPPTFQPFSKPSSHSPHPHSIPRRFSSVTPAPQREIVLATPPFTLEWSVVAAFIIEFGRTWVG